MPERRTGGGIIVSRNRVGNVEEEHADDRAQCILDRLGLRGLAETLLERKSNEFFEDNGGTGDIEIAVEQALFVRGADLLDEILGSLVRRAAEETLPVLELNVIDVGDAARYRVLRARRPSRSSP